jgi:hypothetical protein
MAWVLKANHKSCDYRPDKALILYVCATYEAYFARLLYVPYHIFYEYTHIHVSIFFLETIFISSIYLLTCGDLIEIEHEYDKVR